jgi:hypothetical protein
MQGAQAGHPSAILDGLLKASTWVGNVAQKSERVEQVRLTAGVGTHDEHRLAKGNVNVEKIAPVLEKELGEAHWLAPHLRRGRGDRSRDAQPSAVGVHHVERLPLNTVWTEFWPAPVAATGDRRRVAKHPLHDRLSRGRWTRCVNFRVTPREPWSPDQAVRIHALRYASSLAAGGAIELVR